MYHTAIKIKRQRSHPECHSTKYHIVLTGNAMLSILKLNLPVSVAKWLKRPWS